jgi:hypothetical protein
MRLVIQLMNHRSPTVETCPPEADKAIIGLWTTHGKMLRPNDADVAFSKHHAGAFVSFDATWSTGAAADETCIDCTRRGAAAMEKHADGACLQWAGFEDERKAASGEQCEDIERLKTIKKKHDPDFLFPSWIQK